MSTWSLQERGADGGGDGGDRGLLRRAAGRLRLTGAAHHGVLLCCAHGHLSHHDSLADYGQRERVGNVCSARLTLSHSAHSQQFDVAAGAGADAGDDHPTVERGGEGAAERCGGGGGRGGGPRAAGARAAGRHRPHVSTLLCVRTGEQAAGFELDDASPLCGSIWRGGRALICRCLALCVGSVRSSCCCSGHRPTADSQPSKRGRGDGLGDDDDDDSGDDAPGPSTRRRGRRSSGAGRSIVTPPQTPAVCLHSSTLSTRHRHRC